MSSTIKFAIIGFGYIGQRHAGIIQGHPACELVAACDPTEACRKKGEAYGIPVFETTEALLQAGLEIDCVSVCTPNGVHAAEALRALEHRKHVVIEKPMALTKAECEQVLFKSLQMSRYVFCVMQNRFSPTSQWLKQIVDQELLGKIYLAQVNCFWNRNDAYYAKSDWKGTLEMDGGPLFTQFSHFMDVLYWLLGDIADIHATFANFNHRHNTEFEDSGQVNFRFINGGLGTFTYSTSVWNSNYESSVTIIGEKGTVKVGGQYMEKVEYVNIEGYEMPELPPPGPPNDYGDYKGSAASHHYIFENVVDTLQGNSSITTNALEGLKVVEIIERIYAQRELKDFERTENP